MALSHVHLVLNHIPVIGSVAVLGLLLLALVRRSADLRRAGLEVAVIVGMLTLPAYLTGVGAQPPSEERTELLKAAIGAHHDAALLGSTFMLLTAMFAWIGLWQTRRLAEPARGVFGAVMVLSTATLAMMGRAANLGGQIKHPEVSALEAKADGAGWMTGWIANVANFQLWSWPAAEALHFIGLWLLFGILLAVNMRLLGAMKSVGYSVLHRLLPWAMLGLTVNVVTGMMFVIGLPGQYAGWTFYWKIGLLMVGGLNLLYLTIADDPWRINAGGPVPGLARLVAGAGLVSWLGVMYLGRMLPFLGKAF